MTAESWLYVGHGVQISAGFVLTGWIVFAKNCKGVSGRTQIITALIHWLRVLYDATEPTALVFSIITEAIMSLNSLVLLYLIYVKYKKTVEKEFDTFWIELAIMLSAGLAMVYNSNRDDPVDVLYSASWYLEAGCLFPQLYFNLRTGSKKLSVSLYVLGCLVYKSIIIIYLLKTSDEPHYFNTLYPSYFQMATCVCYFGLLILVPRYEETKPLYDIESSSQTGTEVSNDTDSKISVPVIVVRRPELHRQQSLLEMPFLKKTLPSMASLANSISSEVTGDPIVGVGRVRSILNKNGSPGTNGVRPTLNRTISVGSSLSSMSKERGSGEDDDEGITFTVASKGRKSFQRQTSLPEASTATLDSSVVVGNSELIPNVPPQSTFKPIEQRPFPPEPADIRVDNKNQPVKRRQSNVEPNRDRNQHKRLSGNLHTSPTDESMKNKKQRRATIHQLKLTETSQHNWKIMASNFIGIDSRLMSTGIHHTNLFTYDESFEQNNRVVKGTKDRRY